ncbi:MAG: hypothetical protein WKF40_04945 [Thermoleophilaceae bacterium]
MGSRLLTAAEVASLLRVPAVVGLRAGPVGSVVPVVTLGRYRRFREESIREWVERHEGGRGAGAVGACCCGGR